MKMSCKNNNNSINDASNSSSSHARSSKGIISLYCKALTHSFRLCDDIDFSAGRSRSYHISHH